jgi:hypothetical protein
MSIRYDHDALESLPLKLMIVAIVASLSVIPAGQALGGFRNRDFMTRAQLELESVMSAAQVLMIDGPGGVRTLHLDFGSDGSLAFDHLTIGDGRGGPNMSSVVLRLASGASLIRTATEPEVWMRSISGDSLIVDTPKCDLRLSTQLENRTAFVLVELA